MNDDIKKQAVAHILETTKTRNYRKHLPDNLMSLIVRDVLNTMNEWDGPESDLDDEDDNDLDLHSEPPFPTSEFEPEFEPSKE